MVRITSKDALIIVDVQVDFCPGGALPVPEGDRIIPTVNEYIEMFKIVGQPIFATRDWHPENHISFKENGGIWPRHCVQNTEGAKFHPDLKLPLDAFIISKGDKPELEAYSGFQGTILHSLLRERGIKRVFICGLATDYCVKETAVGALNLGYTTFILFDAVKGVNVGEGDSERAVEILLRKEAILLSLKDFIV